MPEYVFEPLTSYRDAVQFFEEFTGEKIRRVSTKGKHREVETKDGSKARLVFSEEPLKQYGQTLGIPRWKNKKGVSLEVSVFQDCLQDDELDLIVHVLGDSNIYISKPEEWREFLNNSGFKPIWKVGKTEEKVLSMPLEKLRHLKTSETLKDLKLS